MADNIFQIAFEPLLQMARSISEQILSAIPSWYSILFTIASFFFLIWLGRFSLSLIKKFLYPNGSEDYFFVTEDGLSFEDEMDYVDWYNDQMMSDSEKEEFENSYREYLARMKEEEHEQFLDELENHEGPNFPPSWRS